LSGDVKIQKTMVNYFLTQSDTEFKEELHCFDWIKTNSVTLRLNLKELFFLYHPSMKPY
jgi:hypothetical protein